MLLLYLLCFSVRYQCLAVFVALFESLILFLRVTNTHPWGHRNINHSIICAEAVALVISLFSKFNVCFNEHIDWKIIMTGCYYGTQFIYNNWSCYINLQTFTLNASQRYISHTILNENVWHFWLSQSLHN